MDIKMISTWITIAVIAFGAAGSWAVNDKQIEDNKEDIEELQESQVQQIRIEERQKVNTELLRDIQQTLKEIKNQ